MLGLILPASVVAQGPAGLGHERPAKNCSAEHLGKLWLSWPCSPASCMLK